MQSVVASRGLELDEPQPQQITAQHHRIVLGDDMDVAEVLFGHTRLLKGGVVARQHRRRELLGDSPGTIDQEYRPILASGSHHDLGTGDRAAVPGEHVHALEAAEIHQPVQHLEVIRQVAVPVEEVVRPLLDHQDPAHAGIRSRAPFVEHQLRPALKGRDVGERYGTESNTAIVAGVLRDEHGEVGDHRVELTVLTDRAGRTGE